MSVQLSELPARTDLYRFAATTLDDALAQMKRLGPADGDGHHAASCDIQAGVRTSDLVTRRRDSNQQAGIGWVATAEIDSATLEYRVVYLFPEWTNFGTLAAPVSAEWLRYLSCLWVHESGHLQIALPLLRRHVTRLEGLHIAGTGTTAEAAGEDAERALRFQVGQVHALLRGEVTQAFAGYDARTRHGRSQGARLNTRVTGARGRGRR